MRILFLSDAMCMPNKASAGQSYNGMGWFASLLGLLQGEKNIQLGFCGRSPVPAEKQTHGSTTYYPIYEVPQSGIAKIRTYYGGYKHWNKDKYVDEILSVIEDFRPAVIHLFGMESSFATILGRTEVPVAVHLQGLLAPYDNAFFPVGLNKTSFMWPFSKREWVMRNGYIFAKNNIHVRGVREREMFKSVAYTMGRTEWDYQVSQLLAPTSIYYKVNEVLRGSFYEHAGMWRYHGGTKPLTIVSTISQTIYKGLDLVLKTAALLREETEIDFRWLIVGIKEDAMFVRFFEHNLKICSRDVNVSYAGVLTEEQLCQQLLEADVYVHPSYIDNSPNSLCEAQLLGLPVVGTNVGGVSSLIEHGRTGLIVPANAPYELAFLLKKLSADGNLCRSLGSNAVSEASRRHDKTDITHSLLSAYQDIINRNGQRS